MNGTISIANKIQKCDFTLMLKPLSVALDSDAGTPVSQRNLWHAILCNAFEDQAWSRRSNFSILHVPQTLTMMKYDAVIIGSGQAGSPLATKLAKAGWKTVLIEKRWVSGTCVNDR